MILTFELQSQVSNVQSNRHSSGGFLCRKFKEKSKSKAKALKKIKEEKKSENLELRGLWKKLLIVECDF